MYVDCWVKTSSFMDLLLWSLSLALVARTSSLRDVSFNWNVVSCAEYEKQVKAEEVVKGDLIHMIQWYYVDDPAATLKFFHSLLRENGKLLIIHEADEAHSANSGWEVLWKTFKKEPCTNTLSDYLSAGDIKVQLDALELRYEELVARNARDITECFTEGSRDGEMLTSAAPPETDECSSTAIIVSKQGKKSLNNAIPIPKSWDAECNDL
uniref:Uncharacterized protein n=1 Tax=Pygocentrus nattereri TaxID=42514 RepID=A0AAR2KYQ0_PYGNA